MFWEVSIGELTINHPRIGDLRVSLTSPAGTTVVLIDQACSASPGAANFTNISLADYSSQPIGSVCPPAPNGFYRPSNPFGRFFGEPAAGRWTLTVSDVQPLLAGTLESWTLRFIFCPTNCISRRFQGEDVPKSIPDGGSVSSSRHVFTEARVTSVLVEQLSITHPRIGDLRVSLTSPAGTTVVLVDQVCDLPAGMADFSNITLDDSASLPIGSVCPPAPGGIYRPSNPLAAFKGENPTGMWTLTVSDVRPTNTGTLQSWGLFIASCSTGVQMATFKAKRAKRAALVTWRTASELDIVGFNVYRERRGRHVRRNLALIRARGGTGHTYVFRDPMQSNAPARYWLEVVRLDGSRTRHGPALLR